MDTAVVGNTPTGLPVTVSFNKIYETKPDSVCYLRGHHPSWLYIYSNVRKPADKIDAKMGAILSSRKVRNEKERERGNSLEYFKRPGSLIIFPCILTEADLAKVCLLKTQATQRSCVVIGPPSVGVRLCKNNKSTVHV